MRRLMLLSALLVPFAAFGADAPAAKPANEKCPFSNKPIDAAVKPVEVTKSDGTKVQVGFCCEKCLAKAEKDPAAVAKKLESAK